MARSTLQLKDNAREIRLHDSRSRVMVFVLLLMMLLLAGRAFYLQVFRYDHYRTISDENRIQTSPIAPNRGLILDRNGKVLAENQPSFALGVIREQAGDLDQLLATLTPMLKLTADEVKRFRDHIKHGVRPLESVQLRLRLSEEDLAAIAVNHYRLPGVMVETELVRHYPHGEMFSHALGYVNRISDKDVDLLDPVNYGGTHYIGRTGVERQYESVLHGRVGYQQAETNAYGRIMRVLDRIDPQPGSNLSLYIDYDTQKAAYDALAGRRGAVVALDTLTGGVIAFVSTPGFDPNLFVTGISSGDYRYYIEHPDRPLYNRAIQGQYPPGSTIKPMMAMAALHYRVFTPEMTISDPGFFRLPGDSHQYRDWKKGGHGTVDVHRAIVVSCDTFFYTAAYRMGIDRMAGFLGGFGLGRKTGIDVPNELSGVLPSPAWKEKALKQPWYGGETISVAIGQGYMLMTPLQLAVATATIANRGFSVTPVFVHKIDDADLPSPPRRRTVAVDDPHNWDIVFSGMSDVVKPGGTASNIGHDLRYTIAGKTGTAQVRGIAQGATYHASEIAERHRDHALFMAFAPVEKPRIAVAVIVENGQHGNTAAAPIARTVLDTWLLKQPDFVAAATASVTTANSAAGTPPAAGTAIPAVAKPVTPAADTGAPDE